MHIVTQHKQIAYETLGGKTKLLKVKGGNLFF